MFGESRYRVQPEMTIGALPAVRPLTIAHRAGNDLALAHTAHEAGADFIEADVWLHRGRLEVRHTKTMPMLPLLWDRWSIEPGWCPRLLLQQLLDGLPAETGLMLDLKGNDPRLAGAVMHALNAQPRTGLVAVCSSNWSHVDAFFGYVGVTPIHSVGKARRVRPLFAHLASHTGHEPATVSIHQRLLDPGTIRALKDAQAQLITWPVNDATRAEELLSSGVDGVISDDINLVRRLVAAR